VKSSYVIPGIPPEMCKDSTEALTAALAEETVRAIDRARDQFIRGRQAYNPKTQPRTSNGRFRKILARLRYDLGDTELQGIVSQIKSAEKLADTGDIQKSKDAAGDVITMIDRIDEGVLDDATIKNVRDGSRELGKVLAYLPLPQGTQNEKVRFSDLPKSTRDLIEGMVERVMTKDSKSNGEAVAALKSYMSGGRTMSSDDISSELNKLLRLLT